MTHEKKILMSMFSYSIPENNAQISAVSNTYLEKLNDFGLVPLLVSGNMSPTTINTLYELSDGILIPGGRDLNSSLYHQERHPKTKVPDDLRDDLEMTIIKRSLKDGKPLLGICRGAQALAIACGGSLIQHLPDIVNERHGGSEEDTVDHPIRNVHHEVIMVPGTKAANITKKGQITIVSKHHQAIKDTGSLITSGRSPEGIIEIVEHPSLPFHIGIQGHIELDHAGDVFFNAFSKAINTHAEACASC